MYVADERFKNNVDQYGIGTAEYASNARYGCICFYQVKYDIELEIESVSILFINACVRENSRTLVLAQSIMKDMNDEITEVNLNSENIVPLNRELLKKREHLTSTGNMDDPMFRYAKQFAEADEIVIAAPFWDLSFPSILKMYIEQITVSGITFKYNEGRPVGLCKAKRLTYVTTSGGPIFEDFGYTYVKTIAKSFYGVRETKAYRAMNLDVDMITPEEVLTKATILEIE
jgi:FMN-dependent NADH-azoreductase